MMLLYERGWMGGKKVFQICCGGLGGVNERYLPANPRLDEVFEQWVVGAAKD